MKTGDIRIESPCTVDWESMSPRSAANGRFCGDCQKVVRDLSSMRASEAKNLLANAPAGLCVRYLHDEYGNVWFEDQALLSRGNLLKKAAGLAALAMTPLLTACMGAYMPELDDSAPHGKVEPAAPEVAPDADGGAGRDARADARSDAAAEPDAEPDAEADPDAGAPEEEDATPPGHDAGCP